jgi:hypothetical protein
MRTPCATNAFASTIDDLDDLEEEEDAPITLRFTVPLGIGVSNDESGFAYGIAGAISFTRYLSVPVHLNVQTAAPGGMIATGLRIDSPYWVFGELLLGYIKNSYYFPSIGGGAGLGVEVPLGMFGITGEGLLTFNSDGKYFLLYGGPTLRF